MGLKPEFIHVPKTGGTSLKRALRLPQTGHKRLGRGIKDVDNKMIFSLLRCPIDRAASGFHFLKQAPGWKIGPKRKNRGTKHFKVFKLLMQDHEIEINDFLSKIKPKKFPIHIFDEQHTWFTGTPHLMDRVVFGDFEKWDEMADLVAERCGLTVRERENKIYKTERPHWKEELTEVTVDHLKEVYRRDFEFLDQHGIPHAFTQGSESGNIEIVT